MQETTREVDQSSTLEL